MNRQDIYWGSVRFFKHLIVVIVVMCLLATTSAAVILGVRNADYRHRLEAGGLAQSDAPFDGGPGEELPDSAGPEELSGSAAEELSGMPAYTERFPDLYAESAERASVNVPKTVYLTFDDGPSERTDEILEILERYGVKATFFVVGNEDETSRQRMRRITEAGHTLGMHTYSHDYETIYSSVEDYLTDFERVYRLIYDATGVYPQIFRFPGGSINGYNTVIYEALIGEMTRRGFVYFDWNVATGDAAGTSQPSAMVKNALSNCEVLRRAVVLMHDSRSKVGTVEALPAIIDGYRDAGFSFEALTPEVAPVIFGYDQSSNF